MDISPFLLRYDGERIMTPPPLERLLGRLRANHVGTYRQVATTAWLCSSTGSAIKNESFNGSKIVFFHTIDPVISG